MADVLGGVQVRTQNVQPILEGDLPECTGAPKSMDFWEVSCPYWIHVWLKKKCICFLVYHENQPVMYVNIPVIYGFYYQTKVYGDVSVITQRETPCFCRENQR